jgi:beta propeller repeat protein
MLRMNRAVRTCAFAFGVVAFAASVHADSGTTIQLGGGVAGTQQNSPALSGAGVVWTNFDGAQFDIYYQDVSVAGGTPSNLTGSLPGDQFLEDIDRGTVVFTNTKPGAASSDILTIDATTKVVTNIASGGTSVNFAHPAIGTNWIVFERITTQYDIDLADRVSGTSPGFQITFDAAAQRFPRVSGNVVVYEDYNADPSVASVAACIIGTAGCNTFTVAAVGRQPDIDGDNVVFVGKDAAGSDQIYLYNIPANLPATAITNVASAKSQPRISGNRVVWNDQRSGDYDIYSYDLTLKTETKIVGTAGLDETLGDIDGDRVVYGTGAGAVYLYTFGGAVTSDLPPGCDPAKTDLVDSAVSSSQPTKRPVYSSRKFQTLAGKTYYLCVEDGAADGSHRTSQIMAAVDNGIVLTPADFKPEKSPPHFVAAQLSFDHDHGRGHGGREHQGHDDDTSNQHEWDAALFGAPGSHITVSIRVAK